MRLDYLFDFGSPNSYLVHKALPQVSGQIGRKFNYVPVLLGGIFKATGGRSPIETYAAVESRMKYDALEIERFCADYGIDNFKFNPHFPINTLALMRGAVAAQKLGIFEHYLDTIFSAMWEEERNFNDVNEIASALTNAGIDAQELIATTQDADVKKTLIENTEKAIADGVFGVPTFFVGDDMYFGKDRLHVVASQFQTRPALAG